MQMPQIEAFRDRESDYATLAHEMTHWTRQLTHWTRHQSRLNRDLGRKRFGVEELVAEIGAPSFACLYRFMAQSPERRQARDLHRRSPRAKGC